MSERKMGILGVPEVIERNPAVEEKIDYAQRLQELIDPNNHIERASELIGRGAYPIFYSNHNQHVNIAGMRNVYNSLSQRPEDLYFAVAYSLLNSGQERSLISFAQGLMPLVEKESVHFVPVGRAKDIAKVRKDEGNEAARRVVAVTRSNLDFLYSTLEDDAGFIFFPETTTQGAVKHNGTRSGMIRVDNTMFSDFIDRAGETGRELAFIPVGMVDTNKIAEPRTSKPHMRVLFEIGKEKTRNKLGVKLGGIKPLAKVVVGEPFLWGNQNTDDVNGYLMGKVAELLPADARGYYR